MPAPEGDATVRRVNATSTGAQAAMGPAGGAVPRRVLAPLALRQFVASFSGSNMKVAIKQHRQGSRDDSARRPDRDHAVFSCAWRR
jgi:hypothetical protein